MNDYLYRVLAKDKHYHDCKIRLAGLNILVKYPHRETLKLVKDYLADFNKPDLTINVTKYDIDNNCIYLSLNELSKLIHSNVDISFNENEIEPIIIHRKIADTVPSFNTFLMHGAVVAKDGLAYMFASKSGVGKTTRIRIWLEEYPDSIVVNGDKPLIKITKTAVFACGTPWCGKEGWNSNIMVPLKAIFLLERAANNSVELISLGEAFPLLLQQTHRPSDPEAMRKTIQLIKSLEGKVAIYRLKSAPTSDAIHLAYETACHR